MMPRIFIASPVESEYWPALQTMQQQLQLSGFRYHLIRPQNFHMTSVFLGEVNQEKLQDLYLATQSILAKFNPIELHTKVITGFPSAEMTRALAVTLTGKHSTKMQRQVSKIKNELRKLDLWFGSLPFVPHVTLGRTNKGSDYSQRLPARVEKVSMRFSTMELFVSLTTDHGQVEYALVKDLVAQS